MSRLIANVAFANNGIIVAIVIGGIRSVATTMVVTTESESTIITSTGTTTATATFATAFCLLAHDDLLLTIDSLYDACDMRCGCGLRIVDGLVDCRLRMAGDGGTMTADDWLRFLAPTADRPAAVCLSVEHSITYPMPSFVEHVCPSNIRLHIDY
jgi:hypothetical protein